MYAKIHRIPTYFLYVFLFLTAYKELLSKFIMKKRKRLIKKREKHHVFSLYEKSFLDPKTSKDPDLISLGLETQTNMMAGDNPKISGVFQ